VFGGGHASELSKHAVADVFNDHAAMLDDLGIDQDAQVFLQLDVRTFLVHAGQAAVASNIRPKDGRKPALSPFGGQVDPCNLKLVSV
jgi:hypothetical protein